MNVANKIGVIEENNCYFLFVDDNVFNNFDGIIKKGFISICHGYRNSNKYKISLVAREFLERLDAKKTKDQIGYIGEFLYHIFVKYVMVNYKPISIFFNTEEKSAKKGFDMLLSDGQKIWYSEVKSGQANSIEQINDINAARFSTAHSDLCSKVESGDKNIVYWTTAIDKLCMCITNEIDETMISNLLNNDMMCDEQKSKIIVSVIFHDSDVQVQPTRIIDMLSKWRKTDPNIIGVCIRKRTIERVINVIRELSENYD